MLPRIPDTIRALATHPVNKHLLRALRIAWLIVSRAFLIYAVIFSVVGTIAIAKIAAIVLRPINEVRALVHANPAESSFMAECRESLRAKGAIDSLRHTFVPLDSISPQLVQAVVAAEDDAFYTHPGFDVAAILAAAEINRSRNKVVHGGSTITQQLAKNLFLSNRRSFERKYMELIYAVLMESFLGKERILELYLNYAQWGADVFGAEAAAQEYFGKPASKLTLFEASRMAATLAMPAKLNPKTSRSALIGKRLFTIATNMYLRHSIADTTFTALTGAPAPVSPDDSAADSLRRQPTDSAANVVNSVDAPAGAGPDSALQRESVDADQERVIRREKQRLRVDR